MDSIADTIYSRVLWIFTMIDIISCVLSVSLCFCLPTDLNWYFLLQLTNEPHFSQGMFHFDYRVSDLSYHLRLFCYDVYAEHICLMSILSFRLYWPWVLFRYATVIYTHNKDNFCTCFLTLTWFDGKESNVHYLCPGKWFSDPIAVRKQCLLWFQLHPGNSL